MTLKELYANITLDFVSKYSPEIIEKARKLSKNPKQLIKSHILQHMDYGTIVLWWEQGELIGVCNFDVTDTVAHIKNCVVHPQYRHKNILQNLTKRALITWPFLTHLEFERSYRNDLNSRKIAISRLLKSASPLA